MKTFDVEKSVIAREDLTDGVDFISGFAGETSMLSGRLAGSETETACAREIRNRLHDESAVKTRLEAYYAYPMLGRGSLPFLGLWYMLSLVLYYVSFAGGRVAGALLTALALVVFLSGGAMIMLLFVGDKKLAGILTKKVSYNVVSEYSKQKSADGKTRAFIIIANHDAKMGGFFGDAGLMRKLTILIAPISAFLFVLFCILKMALGFDSVAKITAFSVLPAIFVALGAFVLFTHYSPFVRHAKENNGIATAVGMATYAYFVEHDDKLPSDAKIVFVSLGGENSAHGGSQAFCKAHPEFSGAKVVCLQDITSGDLQVAECDPVRKIEFSTPVVSVIRSSAHEQGIDIATVPHTSIPQKLASLHGYISNDFAKNGNQTATIVANRQADHVLDRNDIEKLFSLAVGSLEKLFSETEKPLGETEKPRESASNDMEIKDVESK